MSGRPLDILVVSQACLSAVNRAPYRELADRGWNVELVVPKAFAREGFAKDMEGQRPGDPPMTPLRLVGTHPRWWVFDGLEALIAERKPAHIILDVDPGSRLANNVGRSQARHGGATYCISCDNMPRTFRGELRAGITTALRFLTARSLARLARRYITHVFAISEDIRTVVASAGFKGRVSVMPLGFDSKLFQPDSAARAQIRSRLGLRTTTIAYFGRLSPEKGVHVLLDALGGLRNESWQLLIDEFKDYKHPYALQLRAQIDALGLADRVVFFDAKHEEMGSYMNATDIVVVASQSSPRWKEQYGRVAPEAMATGRTVVVTNCGALPELVADAGVIVPEHDMEALRDAIRQLIRDPRRRAELGKLATRRAHAMLSASRQAELMHHVLRRHG